METIVVNDIVLYPIKDFKNYYISLCGKVYSNRNKSFNKITTTHYKKVWLNPINKKSKYVYIHRLLAETFIFNLENKPCINHIDGNKLNNDLSNLEWCTKGENNSHGFKTGLIKHNMKGKFGALHPRAVKIQRTDCYGDITKYDSIVDCIRLTAFSSSSINRALNYGTKYMGCEWKRI